MPIRMKEFDLFTKGGALPTTRMAPAFRPSVFSIQLTRAVRMRPTRF